MKLVLCLAFAVLPTPSEGAAAKDLAARMEVRYRAAKTLQATFLERYAENGSTLRAEAGTAYFRRPGKMRWEYVRPEKDLFLVDGKSAWFYVPADHTVTRVPAKQSGDLRTPLALLAGQMKLSRICAQVELADAEKPLKEGNSVLRCQVRGRKPATGDDPENSLDAARIDSVLFEIVPGTGELARLLVRQAGGIEVEFRFENWRFDPPIDDEMFHFVPPPGVAIVNGELAVDRIPGN